MYCTVCIICICSAYQKVFCCVAQSDPSCLRCVSYMANYFVYTGLVLVSTLLIMKETTSRKCREETFAIKMTRAAYMRSCTLRSEDFAYLLWTSTAEFIGSSSLFINFIYKIFVGYWIQNGVRKNITSIISQKNNIAIQ